MSEPLIASKEPYGVDVEAGKTYWWCRCGRSKQQPFCDGSHQGTEFVPLEYIADETRQVWFCGCKHTADEPLCDGTHAVL